MRDIVSLKSNYSIHNRLIKMKTMVHNNCFVLLTFGVLKNKMTKQEHIGYWISNSKKDWKRAERCFRDKDYVFTLFFVHLSMEKICKALWVLNNKDNHPPRIHNLEKILRESIIDLADADWILLVTLNRFNLEGRYPDYKNMIYKECTKAFTTSLFSESKKLKQCLLKKMQ